MNRNGSVVFAAISVSDKSLLEELDELLDETESAVKSDAGICRFSFGACSLALCAAATVAADAVLPSCAVCACSRAPPAIVRATTANIRPAKETN